MIKPADLFGGVPIMGTDGEPLPVIPLSPGTPASAASFVAVLQGTVVEVPPAETPLLPFGAFPGANPGPGQALPVPVSGLPAPPTGLPGGPAGPLPGQLPPPSLPPTQLPPGQLTIPAGFPVPPPAVPGSDVPVPPSGPGPGFFAPPSISGQGLPVPPSAQSALPLPLLDPAAGQLLPASALQADARAREALALGVAERRSERLEDPRAELRPQMPWSNELAYASSLNAPPQRPYLPGRGPGAHAAVGLGGPGFEGPVDLSQAPEQRERASSADSPVARARGGQADADGSSVNPGVILPLVTAWLERRDEAYLAERDRRSRRQREDEETQDGEQDGRDAPAGALDEITSAFSSLFRSWPAKLGRGVLGVASVVFGGAAVVIIGAARLAVRVVGFFRRRRSPAATPAVPAATPAVPTAAAPAATTPAIATTAAPAK